MMEEFIPVNIPLFDGNEKKYLCECIDTGWVSSEGPFVRKFEEEMAEYVGRKYAVAVSSGTAALEAAVLSMGFDSGSEVIIPSFTIISCAQAVTKAGLVPVVVDCRPDNWNMDVDLIEKKITSKTCAIMAVHIYGLPVDMDKIYDLAHKYHLKIIEDAAEMHGQTYKGKKCGSFGEISIFSFYPNKHITCGEGGMILTDDENIADECRKIRNLYFTADRYIHQKIGSNFRMTNLQAAVGVAQLEKIEEHVQVKRKQGKLYNELLSDIEDITLPVARTEYADNIYWIYGIVLGENYAVNASELITLLREKGVGARNFFYPVHLQPVYTKDGYFKDEKCPHAEKLYQKGLYIPTGTGMTEQQVYIVAQRLKETLKLCRE